MKSISMVKPIYKVLLPVLGSPLRTTGTLGPIQVLSDYRRAYAARIKDLHPKDPVRNVVTYGYPSIFFFCLNKKKEAR